MKKTLLLALFALLGISFGYSKTILVQDLHGLIAIGSNCDVYQDTSRQLQAIDLVNHPEWFSPELSETPNYGKTKDVLWFRLKVKNVNESANLFLQLRIPIHDHVSLFKTRDGKIVSEEHQHEHSFMDRTINHQMFHFPLDLQEGEEAIFLLRVEAHEELIVPLSIGTERQIYKSIRAHDVFFWIFMSVLSTLVLYNLFVYLSVKDKAYIKYILYMVTMIIVQANRHGYLTMYLWPEADGVPNFVISQMAPAIVLSIFPFLFHFLQITKKDKVSFYGCWTLIVLLSVGVVTGWFGLYYISRTISMNCTLGGALLLIYMTVAKIRTNYRPAMFFMASWSLFMLAVIYFHLSVAGLFPYSIFSEFAPEIGACFEGIVLSLALADRINVINKEKQASQKQALEFQKKVEEVLREYNDELEEKVELRTKEVNEANTELKRQALSAKINPHFVFNVLNSIQGYILSEDLENADKYLSKFSKLMRFYLTSAMKKQVPLEEEMKAIQSYLELEKLRFSKKLNYEINIDLKNDQDIVHVPVMVIIPFLENAIWHGVAKQPEKGTVSLTIKEEDNHLVTTIEDNGIGYLVSQKAKQTSSNHESAGMSITKDRLKLYSREFGSKYRFEMIDKSSEGSHGTRVTLNLPYQIVLPEGEEVFE